MIPGPTYFYKCKGCGVFLKRESLMSGNTFGGQFYSDGKMHAPMMPDYLKVGKCIKCNTIIWPGKEPAAAKYAYDETPRHYGYRILPLAVVELVKAIETGVISERDEELYAREQIWWRYNDLLRDKPDEADDVIDDTYFENCKAMILLLNPNDLDDRITMSELHRNLGNFNECRQIISRIRKPGLKWLKDAFMAECDKQNRGVFSFRLQS